MPRRPPGKIRRHLRHRRPAGRVPQIRGLSASANRQLALFERRNGLPPGEVAHAFRRWALSARRTDVDYAVDDPDDWRAGDCHVRTVLEYAAVSLRRPARREFRAALRPLDDRYLDETLSNPFAPPHLPWWRRRCCG